MMHYFLKKKERKIEKKENEITMKRKLAEFQEKMITHVDYLKWYKQKEDDKIAIENATEFHKKNPPPENNKIKSEIIDVTEVKIPNIPLSKMSKNEQTKFYTNYKLEKKYNNVVSKSFTLNMNIDDYMYINNNIRQFKFIMGDLSSFRYCENIIDDVKKTNNFYYYFNIINTLINNKKLRIMNYNDFLKIYNLIRENVFIDEIIKNNGDLFSVVPCLYSKMLETSRGISTTSVL